MFRSDRGSFQHKIMADYIMRSETFAVIGGTLYIWYNGAYTPRVWDVINSIGVTLDGDSTLANRKEVYNTIMARKVGFTQFSQVDPYKIAFNNGILDVSTMNFITENLTDYAVCNKIPWDYDPNAEYDETVDKQMLAWADGDEDTRELLYQIIGYPMLVNCNLRTMFLLHGSAQGGKTKFVEYIQYIFGVSNYSTFDISEINNRFNKALACGKLFNYSDDIDAGYIEKPNFMKRLISGITAMQVELKGSDGYTAPFYAKLIMSMNEFPKIKMDSDVSAWESRFNIVHFKHKFDVNPNYDKWEKENLKNNHAIAWVIKKSTEAINKAVKDGGFIKRDKEQFNKFMENNNPFLQKALDMTLEDWEKIDDVKTWFNQNKEEYGHKGAWNSFMASFSKMSQNLVCYETSTKNNGVKKRVYRMKERD